MWLMLFPGYYKPFYFPTRSVYSKKGQKSTFIKLLFIYILLSIIR